MLIDSFSDRSEVDVSAACAVKSLEGCEVSPCMQILINDVKQLALDECQVDYLAAGPDAGNSGNETEEECRPSVVCDVDAAFDCVDTLAQADNQSNLCA